MAGYNSLMLAALWRVDSIPSKVRPPSEAAGGGRVQSPGGYWRAIGFSLSVAYVFGCGGGSPSSPTAASSSVDTAGTGSVAAVSGQVMGTIHGQPVVGARVEMGGATAFTDGAGRFQMSVGRGVLPVAVSASNHVTRRSFINSVGRDPVIDVIEPSDLWNLEFYQELCRDGSGGGELKLLNPWTVEPQFYVDRSPESGSGREIPDGAVDTVLEAIRTVVPLLSEGRLRGNQIEVGRAPPADRTPGTVVIRWNPVEVAEEAGPAAGITRGVGGGSSVVVLRTAEDTESIFHELGHVLGLYHPLGSIRPSLMISPGLPERPHFTPWDVLHANILYSRPPGNRDVDNDPEGFIINGTWTVSTLGASQTVMHCYR
ncbi:MAG: hypothetical protein ACE5JI_06535 [Acidobacteriota bacterium]